MIRLHVHPSLGSSIFAPVSESEKIHLNICQKGSASQNMRQNGPQGGPLGTLKGDPNPSKIMKKSSLSRPGCLQVTSRVCRPPKYTKKRLTNDQILTKMTDTGYSLFLQNSTKKRRAFRPVFLAFGWSISAGRVPGTHGI